MVLRTQGSTLTDNPFPYTTIVRSVGICERLEKWSLGGSLVWWFDNDIDALSLDAPFLGFDMTAFLDNPEVRTPIMMYMFHRIDGLLDGRRLVIDIDEFWKALGDNAFRAFAQDGLKTYRKQNALDRKSVV